MSHGWSCHYGRTLTAELPLLIWLFFIYSCAFTLSLKELLISLLHTCVWFMRSPARFIYWCSQPNECTKSQAIDKTESLSLWNISSHLSWEHLKLLSPSHSSSFKQERNNVWPVSGYSGHFDNFERSQQSDRIDSKVRCNVGCIWKAMNRQMKEQINATRRSWLHT